MPILSIYFSRRPFSAQEVLGSVPQIWLLLLKEGEFLGENKHAGHFNLPVPQVKVWTKVYKLRECFWRTWCKALYYGQSRFGGAWKSACRVCLVRGKNVITLVHLHVYLHIYLHVLLRNFTWKFFTFAWPHSFKGQLCSILLQEMDIPRETEMAERARSKALEWNASKIEIKKLQETLQNYSKSFLWQNSSVRPMHWEASELSELATPLGRWKYLSVFSFCTNLLFCFSLIPVFVSVSSVQPGNPTRMVDSEFIELRKNLMWRLGRCCIRCPFVSTVSCCKLCQLHVRKLRSRPKSMQYAFHQIGEAF